VPSDSQGDGAFMTTLRVLNSCRRILIAVSVPLLQTTVPATISCSWTRPSSRTGQLMAMSSLSSRSSGPGAAKRSPELLMSMVLPSRVSTCPLRCETQWTSRARGNRTLPRRSGPEKFGSRAGRSMTPIVEGAGAFGTVLRVVVRYGRLAGTNNAAAETPGQIHRPDVALADRGRVSGKRLKSWAGLRVGSFQEEMVQPVAQYVLAQFEAMKGEQIRPNRGSSGIKFSWSNEWEAQNGNSGWHHAVQWSEEED
jgi:hypothetical protein